VVIGVDRAGIVGEDGETHQGLFDLSMLLAMPNMTVLAPRDGDSLTQMLDFALALNRPVALRYPRGEAPTLAEYPPQPLELGRGEILRQPEGAALGILTLGDMTLPGLELADLLGARGIKAALADLRFAKPLDKALICEFAAKYGRLLIMEDGVQSGGVGENCLAVLQAAGLQAEVELAAFPDKFVPQGKPQQLFALHGLTAEQLCERVCGRWFGGAE
jgi:1-deoxy-D-xylulose-5-phosphate synthase